MLDVRGIANAAIQTINPDISVGVLASDGYTTGYAGKQVPNYKPEVVGPANVQALDGDDLKQLDGLNIQGVLKAIYLKGSVAGIIRPDGTGGDMITFKQPFAQFPAGSTWLVVKVLEGWNSWTKACIVYQGAGNG